MDLPMEAEEMDILEVRVPRALEAFIITSYVASILKSDLSIKHEFFSKREQFRQ